MKPILYSFRRCPYAIRARLAIKVSGIEVQLREVFLRDKPAEMLLISPKGTVPVLQLTDGSVIDESYDIIRWALAKNALAGWLDYNAETMADISNLIKKNDFEFKEHLDRYKYPNQTAGHSLEYYRQQGEAFIQVLDERLSSRPYLFGDCIGIADIAILPFIRQFAHVDKEWFYNTCHKNVQQWLEHFLESDLFLSVMKKQKAWKAGDDNIIF